MLVCPPEEEHAADMIKVFESPVIKDKYEIMKKLKYGFALIDKNQDDEHSDTKPKRA